MATGEFQECPGCGRQTRMSIKGGCMYCGVDLDAPPPESPEPRGQEAAEPTADDGRRRHLLIPDSGPPVMLEPGSLFTIGRLADSNLMINAADVSRQHAEIEWDRDQPMLCELRSSDGTFLNGRRVERPTALRSGDEIRLGDRVLLTYQHLSLRNLNRLLRDTAREATRAVRRPATPRRGPRRSG